MSKKPQKPKKAQQKQRQSTYKSPQASSGLRLKETSMAPYNGQVSLISASDFKAQCLELMDYVQTAHEQIVVTKYGKPVAKLVPVDDNVPDIIGFMRGSVLDYGDLISPIDEPWDADQ